MDTPDYNGIFDMKILRTIIQFNRGTIESEVDTYKEYLYDLNNLAAREKVELEKAVKEMADNSPDDAHDIYEHYSEQHHKYETRYIELANNGALVNAYSFFESQLKDICRSLEKFLVNKVGTYAHVRNLSYAENLRNEIYQVTGLNFTSLSAQWTDLDKYRKIRNVIVHNGANLFEEDGKPLVQQKNYALISSIAQIKLNEDNGDFYIEDKEFVIDYLDKVSDYLISLLEILKTLSNNDIR